MQAWSPRRSIATQTLQARPVLAGVGQRLLDHAQNLDAGVRREGLLGDAVCHGQLGLQTVLGAEVPQVAVERGRKDQSSEEAALSARIDSRTSAWACCATSVKRESSESAFSTPPSRSCFRAVCACRLR